MRRQVKSCRPHLMPACCIAANRASRSGASGRNAVLMPKGESLSNAPGATGGESVTEKLLLAVESGAACRTVQLRRKTKASRCMSRIVPRRKRRARAEHMARVSNAFHFSCRHAGQNRRQTNERWNIGASLPPHPGPLPRGEGEISSASGLLKALRCVERRDEWLPLPWGEGRGEGEGDFPSSSNVQEQ
jgi:hypothetical protein